MKDEMRMKEKEKRSIGKEDKRFFLLTFLSLILFTFVPAVYATIGLSTRFVDVTLENVQVGVVYNLRQLRQMPYVIRNRSDIPVEVEIIVRPPTAGELTLGYEALPDPSWIKMVPNRLRIDANKDGFAEIVLQVPDDKNYVGRHYQAIFRAYTLKTGLFSASVESRFRFSTGPGPESLLKEAKEKAMMSLDFDITPPEFFVDGVEPGIKLNLKKDYQRTIKVTNRAETPLNLKFNSVNWDHYPLPAGYEPTPDPSWLVFKSTVAKIPSDTIVSLEPIIQIPKEEQHYGKKYAFLVKTDIVLGVDLEVYNRIYVRVKEKGE